MISSTAENKGKVLSALRAVPGAGDLRALPPNHHSVLEYFVYMPWPSSEHEDQYLLWWDHEQAIATESRVEYLSPPQQELYLID